MWKLAEHFAENRRTAVLPQGGFARPRSCNLEHVGTDINISLVRHDLIRGKFGLASLGAVWLIKTTETPSRQYRRSVFSVRIKRLRSQKQRDIPLNKFKCCSGRQTHTCHNCSVIIIYAVMLDYKSLSSVCEKYYNRFLCDQPLFDDHNLHLHNFIIPIQYRIDSAMI